MKHGFDTSANETPRHAQMIQGPTRDRITVERKIHELRCVIEDLSTMTATESGLQALRENAGDINSAQRRLQLLHLDVMAMEKVA